MARLVYQHGKPTLRTDYLGPFQYEQDSLRFFPHAEGRVLRLVSTDAAGQATVSYAREFSFKDHLGNLRLAYRLGQHRRDSVSLEPAAHARESQQFDSLSVSAPVAQNVGTALARSGSYAARLNAGGTAPQPLGPLKQLAVQKGDTVTVTAYGLYAQPVRNNFWFSLATFLTGLLNPAQGTPANGPDPARGRAALPLLQVGVATGLASLPQLSNGVPKGYLRLLVFNADSVLVGQQVQPLTSAALNNYQRLRLSLILPQDGYVTTYVGNESDVDVLFDDVTVVHGQGLQVQENQYDPWGMSLAGLDYVSSGSKHLNMKQFNGQEKIADLGLNLYLYRYREYDAQLGRFTRVDPLAEKFPYMTSYQFASNSPIWLRELEGLEGVKYTDVDGGTVIEKNVVVLTEPLKQVPKDASQKDIDKITKQNARTERRNTEKVNAVSAELNTFFNDSDGKGTHDSKGNHVQYKFNVKGVSDFDKKGMTEKQVNLQYKQIAQANGLPGKLYGTEQTAPAAVITREGSSARFGDTAGNIVRLNYDAPAGAYAHEILHTLGPDDNGYNKGGLLASPPELIKPSEANETIENAYEKR